MNTKKKMTRQDADRIGRQLNLAFNQVTMYHVGHPAASRAVAQLYETLKIQLRKYSPILFILSRGQFMVEEELLDSRINTTKMEGYFKKAGIQSLSFLEGLQNEELKTFVNIITDPGTYPSAEHIKKGIAREKVTHVRVNYVFYQKVTADDEVVAKGDVAPQAAPDIDAEPTPGSLVQMMATGIVLEEFEKFLSIQNLIENPAKLSQVMIETDLSAAEEGPGGGGGPGGPGGGGGGGPDGPGPVLATQLQRVREEVSKAMGTPDSVSLPALAQAVFDMKAKLLEGLEAQKTKGIVYLAEEEIRRQADELTDQVMIELVKKEYQKGEISLPRLAQLLRRLIPEVSELRRLLPKIKNALLEEGMSLADFLRLVKELSRELQSEELARALGEGAEAIGVGGDELVREIMRHPDESARLIYLAAEVRRGTGDERVLSDLLVEYVERVGSEIALQEYEESEADDRRPLEQILQHVRTDLVDRLRGMQIGGGALEQLERKLHSRMDQHLSQIKSNWIVKQLSVYDGATIDRESVARFLEENVSEEEDLRKIMDQAHAFVLEKRLDEEQFQKIYDEFIGKAEEPKPIAAPSGLPKGVLNLKSSLFILEKEISRAARYGTPLSALTLGVVRATPQKPVPGGAIDREMINHAAMALLLATVRETDLIGSLGKRMILIMQPMTGGEDARKALQRILKVIHSTAVTVAEIPLQLRFAGVATTFDNDRTPDIKAFLRVAKIEFDEMYARLSSIQSLF